MSEVGAQAELKDQKLKVMESENRLEKQVRESKRQSDDLLRLRASLDTKTESENRLEKQVRESKRQYADLESRMKEEIMMARIRDAENTQRVAELTQKISGLECKNQEMLTEGDLANSMDQTDKVRELQDKIARLRAQVTRLSLLNSKLSQSLSLHNLATSFSSDDGSSPSHTPTRQSPSPVAAASNHAHSENGSSLELSLSSSLQALQ